MKPVLIIAACVIVAAAAGGLFIFRAVFAGGPQQPKTTTAGSLWDFPVTTLGGEAADLADYRGQVALVVNVASKCGFTPQYEGLEALYKKMKDRGFVILAFPSNDFRQQEPGTAEEIRQFCTTNYGVTFPLFEKAKVKGEAKCEIYRFLTTGGLQEPTWNFTKYLVGRDGKVIARYAPKTAPDDEELRTAIMKALGAD